MAANDEQGEFFRELPSHRNRRTLQAVAGSGFERVMTMHSCAERELESGEVPEQETIRLAQAGDAAAFEQLYRRYSGRVYALCLRITKNDSEAEDLTQEAFLLLFRKIHTFRGESKFSTWLHTLTFNVVLMRLRKKRCPEVSFDTLLETGEEDSKPLIEFGAPDLRLTGVIDRMNLSRAIAQLPDGCKRMFILHDVEGYEHHEIAAIVGCTIGNSKSQLFKARARLRKLVQEALRSRARETRESTHGMPVSECPDGGFRCAKA
jgi:RNA polymerase sigma-70 factor (ECF subfamily)